MTNNYFKIREILVKELEQDIVGPRNEEEELPIRIFPTSQYLSGILYPLETSLEDEEEEKLGIETNDAEESSSYDPSDSNIGIQPSSIGISCNVSEKIDKISLKIQFGRYGKTTAADGENQVWKRSQFTKEETIDLIEGTKHLTLDDNAGLHYTIRKNGNHFNISVFITNDLRRSGEKPSPELCIFQPSIKLSSSSNEKIFIVTEPPEYLLDIDKLDEMQFDMLFSKKKQFAIGHGCSATWDVDALDNAVSWVSTTLIPTYEVPVIEAHEMNEEGLKMKVLGSVQNFTEYEKLFSFLISDYDKWINEKEKEIKKLDSKYHEIAKLQIDECREALTRIKKGIEIVSTKNDAGEAFRFANKAMYYQRRNGEWAKNNIKTGKVQSEDPPEIDATWRPFQIAFILLNIESLFNLNSPDRSIADLLWFPTGGGKTEAYLGLIAFTIALRRLRNKGHLKYGVTAIMRYTLRLLTIQQFQRAATLICACEYIRRSKGEQLTKDGKAIPKWGSEPFLVGLWVGGNTTPNVLEDQENSAEDSLNKLRRNKDGKIRGPNPCQLTSCPWCGTSLSHRDYFIGGTIRQLRVACNYRLCEFASKEDDEGIPILVVDEDIYKRCPSLIIGTVDKFAQVSWKPETATIFGRVKQYCEQHGFISANDKIHAENHRNKKKIFDLSEDFNPPELIIQDELHLISGPLGTLTGIYETVIDVLCSRKGIIPKIIASTATIRKSQEQIHKLFNRSNKIFPPNGFDYGDSYFARENKNKKGRCYVGICATSRRGPTILSRISAAIMRKVRVLKEKGAFSPQELDPYYTFVSYFNSIRELGGANRLYEDSVPGMMGVIHRYFEDTKQVDYLNLPSLTKVELTGRVDSSEIPDILKLLELTLFGNKKDVIDVLLCTNMLSVGVDVSRLSVMLINGQPKNTSEYIQASGRIGRSHPGLIITSYNFLKPRDLSHYENFVYYHSTFHKNVEPVSVTPFASRARDRALLGVLIALVRLQESELANNGSAGLFSTTSVRYQKLIQTIRSEIEKRVAEIDNEELDETKQHISSLLQYWDKLAKMHRESLKYRKNPYNKKAEKEFYLMRSIREISDEVISVPESLREAEQSVDLWYATENKEATT